VECTAPGGAAVRLNGSSSSDPDFDILTYPWIGPFPEGGGTVTGVSPVITLILSGWAHTATLTVEDPSAESDSDTVDITVQDTTSPLVGLVSTFVAVVPTTPTETMVDVLAASGVTVSDACDPNPDLTHDAPAELPIGSTTNVTFTATGASGNVDSQVFAVAVLTTSEVTQDLIQDVLSLELLTGIENSLEAMLDVGMNVLNDVNEMNDGAAVNSLMAFIVATEAQRDKKLTDAQANQLIAAAQTIIAALGG
jgi:hypothetical protein